MTVFRLYHLVALAVSSAHFALKNTLFLDQSASDVCLCVIEDAAENQDGFAWSCFGLFPW